jgi:hypothetical protein
MNRSGLMIGVLALALGFLVGVYAYKSSKSRTRVSSEPVIAVIVAADDLQVGTA